MDAPGDLRTPTREAALAAAAGFAPRMGPAYATGRNYDDGPGRHRAVSRLSPFIRRRLVTERELVRVALDAHGRAGAEKFVQEVIWRTYFKGWLERRPSVWEAYRRGLEDDLDAVGRDRGLARRLAEAEDGRTGLDCFDAWARELVGTGYLHNHARMWFASIWIFTLRLPWRLGADFFLRHLLDGDPASNTLGWRWVAGLHTKGKNYTARAWNIAKYTRGRFAPDARELAEDAAPLEEPDPLPPAAPVREPVAPDPALPTALLVTVEDCTPEHLGLVRGGLAGLATLAATEGRSPREVAPEVAAFDRAALADAAARARAAGAPGAHPLDGAGPEAVADWARAVGARQIVSPFVPVGPVRERLDAARPALEAAGIRLAEIRRDWDGAIWPYATAGFFKVKKQIPRILDALG
jgi:hypothetical protein